jgi:hypothetical protein
MMSCTISIKIRLTVIRNRSISCASGLGKKIKSRLIAISKLIEKSLIKNLSF